MEGGDSVRYRIYCGYSLLHDSNLESLRVHNATLDLEMGKSGELNFTIHANHPYYDSVSLMAPGITVYMDDTAIFSGRALQIKRGTRNEKIVYCEGALSYLLDSYIEPDYYYGNFYGYMERLIAVHNGQVETAKQFAMGTVCIADFDDFEVSTSAFTNLLDSLTTHFANAAEGYLQARYEGGTLYLDVLPSMPGTSDSYPQTITFGTNLLDVQRDTDGSEVFSSILPLGDEVSGMRTTIGSVNDWVNYITDADAVARYGLIHKIVEFEGITDPQALKDAAEQYFADYYEEVTNIEIAVTEFLLPGKWVNVYSEKHFGGQTTPLLVKQAHVGITNPTETKITAGRLKRGLSENVASSSNTEVVSATKSGKILWSGTYYMTAGHTITLSELVSQQPSGIVLVFSRYSNGVARNYHFNEFFVSKEWVRLHAGTGHTFMMTNDGIFSIMASKYLYIHDDKIGGNDLNGQTGTGTSGIVYDNSAFVLRYVIGV